MVIKSPVFLLCLPSVMEANHDGEGASRQHLLVVVVVQAVSCCQGKSVSDLGTDENGHGGWAGEMTFGSIMYLLTLRYICC